MPVLALFEERFSAGHVARFGENVAYPDVDVPGT
jgi:hypothetical protein